MTHQLNLRKQAGFSLIEVMIAMTLGLLLLTGIVQIFLTSKQSYSVVLGQSQTLDSGRLGAYFLGDSLRKAGYWSLDFDRRFGSDEGLVADGYTGVFDESEYVFGLNNDAADANVVDGTDQFYVRYSGDDFHTLTNCIGTAIGAGEVAVERYYLRVPGAGETLPSLVCETTVLDINIGDKRGEVTVGAAVTTTQPLISGVENLQLLFGVRNSENGTQVEFETANNVADWGWVDSVKIAMLTASADPSRIAAQRQNGYELLDVTTAAPGDTRTRGVFEQTVALRNPNINTAFN